MKYYIVSFFLFLILPSVAQESKLIRGKVVNDSLGNSTVHIINLSLRSGTITSKDGSFEITVREKDTLLFSSILYVPKKIVISSDVFNGSPLRVDLEKSVNELDEVNISNIQLSGNLDRDLSNLKTFNKFGLGIELSKEPPPTQAERRVMVSPGSINPLGGAVNLDHLINVISGRHALNKLAKANQDLDFLVEEVKNIFPEDFYVDELKIPSEEIIVFLFYCAENADLKQQMQRKNQLQLMEFFKEQAPEFRVHRQLE